MINRKRPRVKLIGEDGNAFAILGKAKKALEKAGYPKEEIKKFLDEAMSGDYSHLLATVNEYLEVY